MEDLNEQYFLRLRVAILTKETRWKNKEITNKQALDFFQEKSREICFFINNNQQSHLRTKMSGLLEYVNILISQVKEEMKNVYIIRTDKTKMIVCADENLVKKCIERLGKDVSVATYKTTICQTEQDIDKILQKQEEPNGDFVFLEFHGLPE